MALFDIDDIVSKKIFNFKLFNYGVSYEQLKCWWWERPIKGKYKKRFWIYQKGKYSIGDDEPAQILAIYDSVDGARLRFVPPHYTDRSSTTRVVYWGNMQDPVDLIERVKARLDLDSLIDHSVFNTKDLG